MRVRSAVTISPAAATGPGPAAALVLLLALAVPGQASDAAAGGGPGAASPSQRYEIRHIQGDIVGFMAPHLDPAAGELEVQVLYPRHAVTLPVGPVRARVHPVGRADRLGRRTFHLQLTVNGRAADTVKVVADVALRAMVVTPVRMIRPQETIGPDDVTLSEVTLRRAAHGYLAGVEQAIGKRAVRPLRAHAPVLEAALAPPHLVKKGQRVTIEARRNGLTIQTIGVTHSSGSLGQVLTVTNVDSNRQIQARVVGPGTVEVDF